MVKRNVGSSLTKLIFGGIDMDRRAFAWVTNLQLRAQDWSIFDPTCHGHHPMSRYHAERQSLLAVNLLTPPIGVMGWQVVSSVVVKDLCAV